MADKPDSGQVLRPKYEDRSRFSDPSRDIFPDDIDSILLAADTGDTQRQSHLAEKILEKDGDILTAVQTRQSALTSTPFEIVPPLHDDSDIGKETALFCDNFIRKINGDVSRDLGDFTQLLNYMSSALLPGFSLSEIIWKPGGVGIDGFQFIPQHYFTLRDSMIPRIDIMGASQPVEIDLNKWVFHRYQHRSGDMSTGGLIRPLGYIYAFKRCSTIDMLRYVEKFGMPFVAAKIDPSAWETERGNMATLVKNFSSDGGAVVSKSVELDFVTPSNGGTSPYQAVLDYFERSVTRLILGQELSTTTGGGGSFALGQVHERIRQDLRASDCHAVAASVKQSLLRLIVLYNYGADAPVPTMKFLLDPPINLQRDSQAFASVAQGIASLAAAGYSVDVDAINKRFGFNIALSPVKPDKETDDGA